MNMKGRSPEPRCAANVDIRPVPKYPQYAYAVVNGFGDTGTVLHQTAAVSHSFDFGGNSYWVRLELDRSSTSQVVIIHSVAVVLAFG
jgi:hypothetical protein